jgi:hypothetical protein
MAISLLVSAALLSMIGVGLGPGGEPSRPPVEPNKLEVSLDGNRLFIRGERVVLPVKPQVLVEILGKPSRVLKGCHVWDELGLIATEATGRASIFQVSVALSRMKYDYWPKKLFRGRLSLDGVTVTADSTVETINRAKKGRPLIPAPDLPFLSIIDYENAVVFTESAKDSELDPAGTIAHLGIDTKR